jgi:hypothetical protein
VTETASDTPVAAPPAAIPRGLVVVLGLTSLLVGTLALRQFSSIVAPVLPALVLVIGAAPRPLATYRPEVRLS